MKKFVDTLRFLFISPEVLSGLIIFFVGFYFPWMIQLFSKLIVAQDSHAVWALVSIPLGLLIAAYKLGFDLLNPKEDKKKLKEWPNYWMLRNRILYSLLLGSLGLVFTIVAYALANHGHGFVGSYLMLVSFTVEAVAVASIAYARITINDVLSGVS